MCDQKENRTHYKTCSSMPLHKKNWISISRQDKPSMMLKKTIVLKLLVGFVYASIILDYAESSYSGVGGYHDEMRRIALVKAAHTVRNRASQPQSYSTVTLVISQIFPGSVFF